MTVSTGARTGATLWTAGSDPVTRAQFQASHLALEAGAVFATIGTLAARPAAAAANAKTFYADENGILYWSSGSAWLAVGAGTERQYTNATATGTVTLDLTAYDTFVLTLTGNVTIALSNPPPAGLAKRFALKVRQDATGGRTLTLPASMQPDGGTAPALSTAANAVAELDARTTDAGTTYQYRLRWASAPAAPVATTLNHTGGPQTVTVPAGRTSLTYDLRGAQGASGGLGGRVQGTIAVTAGAVLQVNVGGAGALAAASNTYVAGGYNGGGAGACSGGGATDIRSSPYATGDRVAVAGGGGGSGLTTAQSFAGGGGGGYWGGGGGGHYVNAGAAGTQSSGGSTPTANPGGAGAVTPGFAGGAGGGLVGVAGTTAGGSTGGGGGGTQAAGGAGGAAGGGSGGSAGGGGGSSYTAPGAAGVVHNQGVGAGDGSAVLTWS